jgi:dienelactone hydrolase
MLSVWEEGKLCRYGLGEPARRPIPLPSKLRTLEGSVSSIIGKSIEYFDGSARLVGYLSIDEALPGIRPGVVLVHDAFGVGDYMKRRADDIAELGYGVLAADIWGDGAQLTHEAEIGPMIARFASDRTSWIGRVEQARKVLSSQPSVDATRIAAVGYCFGGASVLEYLRTGARSKA